MEYWIVYDLATGAERWRGSGVTSAAAAQVLPEGLGIVLVPSQALEGEALDLDVLRNTASASIDAQAEVIRQSILTPGAGQAMTYQRKEAEARAWSLDNDTTTPFLSAEAGAREMTIADLAAEIIELADAWVAIGAAIEGLRMGAKAAVGRAANLGAIVAAGKVDWSVLNG
ncbi:MULTISPECIES: hypothetical protein [unclassified Sphingomonas]|jgi:hypothetical protein|uniref:hypothetical protein n=1 Tax=unclassified Sphingomonas TaxID=196159 RepID=UPI00177FEC81|nr:MULTISPECIES: hypothetical protein [unclassified Sphingomonas]MBD8638287.1 hypothetical protein [Sphingomonas sp. CFBP 13733]MBD8699808.1 hypothetical protein [Sphingomonas sp. CFBP 13714]